MKVKLSAISNFFVFTLIIISICFFDSDKVYAAYEAWPISVRVFADQGGNPIGSETYITTELWFGEIRGGEISHTTGVIAPIDSFVKGVTAREPRTGTISTMTIGISEQADDYFSSNGTTLTYYCQWFSAEEIAATFVPSCVSGYSINGKYTSVSFNDINGDGYGDALLSYGSIRFNSNTSYYGYSGIVNGLGILVDPPTTVSDGAPAAVEARAAAITAANAANQAAANTTYSGYSAAYLAMLAQNYSGAAYTQITDSTVGLTALKNLLDTVKSVADNANTNAVAAKGSADSANTNAASANANAGAAWLSADEANANTTKLLGKPVIRSIGVDQTLNKKVTDVQMPASGAGTNTILFQMARSENNLNYIGTSYRIYNSALYSYQVSTWTGIDLDMQYYGDVFFVLADVYTGVNNYKLYIRNDTTGLQTSEEVTIIGWKTEEQKEQGYKAYYGDEYIKILAAKASADAAKVDAAAAKTATQTGTTTTINVLTDANKGLAKTYDIASSAKTAAESTKANTEFNGYSAAQYSAWANDNAWAAKDQLANPTAGTIRADITDLKNMISPIINSVTGQNGATCTTGTTFTVVISASNANQYCARLSDGAWTAWGSNNIITVSVGSTSGAKTIEIKARNSANTTAEASFSLLVFKI